MSKDLIDSLKSQKVNEAAALNAAEAAGESSVNRYDRPFFISKYTNLTGLEQKFLRHTSVKQGRIKANQCQESVPVSIDTQHTQFLRYLHLNPETPVDMLSDEHQANQMKKLKSFYQLAMAGSITTTILVAKALKPASQKNVLTIGQAILGFALSNLVAYRVAEHKYVMMQREMEKLGKEMAAERAPEFEKFLEVRAAEERQ